MKHFITFQEPELNSSITTLGFNLHSIGTSIIYFKQYAKIHGVENDVVPDGAIEKINESLKLLKYEFNIPIEHNPCLESIDKKKIDEVVKRANKDHDNPYRKTMPKMQELIKTFLLIAEREGRETNWDEIKTKCKSML